MRAGKEMTHHAGVLGLRAEMVADADHTSSLFCCFPSKINSGEADCVRLGRTGARRHVPHSGIAN
jgi:hypothetical protein